MQNNVDIFGTYYKLFSFKTFEILKYYKAIINLMYLTIVVRKMLYDMIPL